MSAAPTTDTDDLTRILCAVAGGDQAAFAELYRRTSSKLFGVCLRMLHERGEAEDALQDVYTAVWRRAQSFDAARAGAMTWLIAMTRNRAIDRLRQRHDAPLDDTIARELVDDQPSPAANTETSQQRQRLERCLDTLEPQQKSAVRAAFFAGDTYNELATRSGVPLATMKSWIRRSLIRLRACLEHST